MSQGLYAPPPPPPPLPPATVEIVFYRDQESVEPGPMVTTWPRFVEFMRTCVEVSPCTVADGPKKCAGKKCVYKSHSAIAPSADNNMGADNNMAWAPTAIEGRRVDKNVRAITLLVLDFDHVTRAVADGVVSIFSRFECIVHTTHNHRGDDDVCLRAILLLSRPVHADQWHRFLPAAIAYLGVTVTNTENERQPDPTCKNRSRFYYLPSHPADAPYDVAHVSGQILDVDAVLAWASKNVPEPPVVDAEHTPLPETEDWDLDSEDVRNAIDLASNYFPTARRNEYAMALAGMLRRAGATEDDARYIVREICAQGGSDEPDKRATTVPHTYSLSDDSWMTGFTRLVEILDGEGVDGSKIAREIGDYFSNAKNAIFLRDVHPNVGTNGAANGTNGVAPTLTLIQGGLAVDVREDEVVASDSSSGIVRLETLRKALSEVAGKRAASLDREDRIRAIILRRVLNGQAIAQPGGEGDVETICEGASHGMEPEVAIRYAISVLAWVVPSGTSWETVKPLVWNSVSRVGDGEDWVTESQKMYRTAYLSRLAKAKKQAEEEAARRALAAAAFGGSGGGGGGNEPPDGPTWQDGLRKGPGGATASTHHNVERIMKNDPKICGTIRWNMHAKRIEVCGGAFAEIAKEGNDVLAQKILNYLSGAWDINTELSRVKHQIDLIAHENKFDPLVDRLNSLVWDGVERMRFLLTRYFGVRDTPHTQRISRLWMVAACARAFENGCKFDNVLIFEGLQGLKKSTAFEVLALGFYCSTDINVRDKDSKMLAACSWIVELAELVSIRKADVELVKGFLTTREDTYRKPFGDAVGQTKRRCVICGCTNLEHYFDDETGHRRFWPVRCGECGEIDIAGLMRDVEQIWAEAVATYLAYKTCPDCAKSTDTAPGQDPRCAAHRWWLSKVEEAEAALEAIKRESDQPWMVWQGAILKWWKEQKTRPEQVEVEQLAFDVGQLPIDRVTKPVQDSIVKALKKLGFKRDPLTRAFYPSDELKKLLPGRGLFALPGGKKDGEGEGGGNQGEGEK